MDVRNPALNKLLVLGKLHDHDIRMKALVERPLLAPGPSAVGDLGQSGIDLFLDAVGDGLRVVVQSGAGNSV